MLTVQCADDSMTQRRLHKLQKALKEIRTVVDDDDAHFLQPSAAMCVGVKKQIVQRIRDNRRIISVEIASVIHRSWCRRCSHGLAFTQILLLWLNEKTCGSLKKNVHKNKTCLSNVKFTIERAMKAQRGVEVYVCSLFNLGFRWDGWSSPRSDRFTTSKQTQYPWYFSDRASWNDYILITNLMHWLLFIHKILFSST